jgi:hypothetical protein
MKSMPRSHRSHTDTKKNETYDIVASNHGRVAVGVDLNSDMWVRIMILLSI